MTPHFILASQSPRRRQLMQLVGYPFSTISANVDESSITHPAPPINAMLVAELKAKKIASQMSPPLKHTIVVAADTIVALNNQMLGKPKDEAEATQMLKALCGKTHEVHTGIVVIKMASGEIIREVDTAVVTMRPYTNEEITTYVATGDPLDKAGAYAVQNPHFKPVSTLQGCYLGVMGLSICHLLQMLYKFQIPKNTHLASLRLAHQHYPCPVYNSLTKHN